MLKLIEMLDKFSHQIEEKDETINELQTELKYRTNENKALYTDSRHLNKELEKATNEIKLLNNQIDNLIEENKQLKFRNKMLTKIGFNSIYGTHCYKNYCVNSVYGSYCCKKHWAYTDTDSIKAESEDNKHGDNN